MFRKQEIGGQVVIILWTGCYYSDGMCAFLLVLLPFRKGKKMATWLTKAPKRSPILNLIRAAIYSSGILEEL